MEQIAKENLIMLRDSFNQTAGIKKRFKQLKLDIKVIHYTSQMYTIERFIEKNVAGGFLPGEGARQNPNIVPTPYEGSEMRAIEIFCRKDHYLYKAVRDFIRTAKELYPFS